MSHVKHGQSCSSKKASLLEKREYYYENYDHVCCQRKVHDDLNSEEVNKHAKQYYQREKIVLSAIRTNDV